MEEKFSTYGRNGVTIAIGGFLACAGLIVLLGALGALGALLAFFFFNAGLDPLLAAFLGLGIIGLVVVGAGAFMLMKGIGALKEESPAPVRTLRTLQHLKVTEPVGPDELPKVQEKDQCTSEQVEASVVATEEQMADTLEELAERLSLSRARQRAEAELRTHPDRWGLIAAGCGAASSLMLKRKLRK